MFFNQQPTQSQQYSQYQGSQNIQGCPPQANNLGYSQQGPQYPPKQPTYQQYQQYPPQYQYPQPPQPLFYPPGSGSQCSQSGQSSASLSGSYNTPSPLPHQYSSSSVPAGSSSGPVSPCSSVTFPQQQMSQNLQQAQPQVQVQPSKASAANFDSPPIVKTEEKKVRIRIDSQDKGIHLKDVISYERECQSIVNVHELVNDYLKEKNLKTFKKAVVKYSPKGNGHFEKITSDAFLKEYITKMKNPFIVVCEVPETVVFLNLVDILSTINSERTRTAALKMAQDNETSEKIMEILKSKAIASKLKKLVDAIQSKVDEEDDSDDDDEDEDDSDERRTRTRRRRRRITRYSDDSDDDDSDSDSDSDSESRRRKPYNIVRDDSSDDDLDGDDSYSTEEKTKIRKVLEITKNALSKESAYKLLEKNNFDVQKAVNSYVESDCF